MAPAPTFGRHRLILLTMVAQKVFHYSNVAIYRHPGSDVVVFLKGIFMNRAAMKMANMDKVFDFMFSNPTTEDGRSLG